MCNKCRHDTSHLQVGTHALKVQCAVGLAVVAVELTLQTTTLAEVVVVACTSTQNGCGTAWLSKEDTPGRVGDGNLLVLVV